MWIIWLAITDRMAVNQRRTRDSRQWSILIPSTAARCFGIRWSGAILAEWQAELPPQSEGAIVRYRIGAWSGDGSEIFADWPEARLTVERSADAYFRRRADP